MKHKSILFPICAAALLCLPFAASAQYFIVGGIAYSVLSPTDHTVEVTYKNSYYSGSVSIPPTVSYGGIVYDVVALGEEAFYRASLSAVNIPSSVTQIKYGCFLFATLPSAINIPASVTEIGQCAFAARNLTSINVDTANPAYRSIDGMLFSKDSSTIVECPVGKSGTVALPSTTRHIAPCAFIYCQSLTAIMMPQGLKSIGYWAFMDNSSLNNVVIPSSVTHIGTEVFGGCQALTSLSLAEGNTHYMLDGLMLYTINGDTLLSCHKSADSVFLPTGLHAVGGFSANSDIRYVHVPEGVSVILDNAFNSSSVVAVDLPEEMELIDGYAFSGCVSLTRVAMPSKLGKMGEGCFRECIRLTSVEIPDSLREIPNSAFFMCIKLKDVAMGNAVETIGQFAFGDCAIVEVQLPPTLRTIRQGAFIGDYPGTAKLRRVYFSGPIDTIEQEVFYKQHLDKLQFADAMPPVSDTVYGCLFETSVDTIAIPCGSLTLWLADSYWERFADKYIERCDGIEPTDLDLPKVFASDGRLTITGAQSERVCVFDAVGRVLYRGECAAAGMTVSLPASGAYIVLIGDKLARKVVAIK